MMLGGVARDSLECDGVVERKAGEQAPLLVGPRGIVGEKESVLLKGRPEEFRCQRVVRGVIPSDHDGHLQCMTDGARILSVKQLHDVTKDSLRCLG
jgi:hypothetical protein